MITIDKKMDEPYNVSTLALVQRKRYIMTLAKVYGMDFFFLNQYNDKQELTQFLPFFVVKDKFIKKKIVSMPFDGGFGGAVSFKGELMNENTWLELINAAKDNKINIIEIRDRQPNVILNRIGFKEFKNLIGSELELNSVDDAWEKISRGHKRSINKFNKHNYQLSVGSTYKDLKEFYHIMSKNMRSYGTPMYPLSYFMKMWDEYHDEGNVVLVKCIDGNKLIGGSLVLFNGEVAIHKYCSVINSYVKDCVYHGILWYIIQMSIERKCRILNLGTSFINDHGLIHFKSEFGAINYTVFSYLYQPDKERYHTVDEMRRKYNFLIKFWKKLPLPITEWGGNLFWRNFC